ncbi:MAG: hypothetical protein JRJ39_00545 [Deltaproteobacteria bacterium]|nr:hypothetical protein [Deltaproteobacteria bacterium]MBW1845598.1 hypothetical protein [Deltaproteobacteria bacterium]MBW2032026.1 hypothetical protein [Deltaproteobacteria bacterium]
MKITAKTQDGFLIKATLHEVKNILTSVNGKTPSTIEIGQKIPAIDYATTITKIKELQNTYEFKNLYSFVDKFFKAAKDLETAVLEANNIEA